LNVNGAVFSTIYSVAKPPCRVALTPLISGRTCGTSSRLRHQLMSACTWRYMGMLLMQIPFAHCMPWLLAPFSFWGCPRSRRDAVCSVLAALFSWLGFLLRTARCLQVRVCALLGAREFSVSSRVAACVLRVAGRCPLPFRSARGAEAEAPLG
jgi:hypothetical protein